MNRVFSGRAANMDDIEAFILANPTTVRAPLILISQVQRSGGTLLGQLLDSHPEVAAYPDELRFGQSDDAWPTIGAAHGEEQSFRMLFDLKVAKQMAKGFVKGDRDPVRHRYFVVPRLQHNLFIKLCRATPPKTGRDIFDLFFTSYFNVWLNYRGDLKGKKWIAAFAPRLADNAASVAAFFENYPDGRLIQVIRDPRTWYPSARNHRTTRLKGKSLEEILERWRVSARSMLNYKRLYGSRVVIVKFEDLVGRTEETMRALTTELAITWDPILLRPTFNGEPVRANSSFNVEDAGVIAAPLERGVLTSDSERKLIEETCVELYEQVAAAALAVVSQPTRLCFDRPTFKESNEGPSGSVNADARS